MILHLPKATMHVMALQKHVIQPLLTMTITKTIFGCYSLNAINLNRLCIFSNFKLNI